MAPDGEIQFNYRCGVFERRGDVAVTLATNGWLRAQARREFTGRPRSIDDGLELVDIDRHQFGSIFRDVGIVGEHRRDRLSDIAHMIFGKHGLPKRLELGIWSLPKVDWGQVRDLD